MYVLDVLQVNTQYNVTWRVQHVWPDTIVLIRGLLSHVDPASIARPVRRPKTRVRPEVIARHRLQSRRARPGIRARPDRHHRLRVD